MKKHGSYNATRTEPSSPRIGGARTSARARLVKVRESVAKSRKTVNEKNARLACRNACAALADPANGRVQ
jgi:hypothetical protein